MEKPAPDPEPNRATAGFLPPFRRGVQTVDMGNTRSGTWVTLGEVVFYHLFRSLTWRAEGGELSAGTECLEFVSDRSFVQNSEGYDSSLSNDLHII